MREGAVKSYAKEKWDILIRAPNLIITSFFPRNKGSDSAEKLSFSSTVLEDKPSSSSCSKDRRIDSTVVSNETIKAEIMWVLKIVISNFSISFCQDV